MYNREANFSFKTDVFWSGNVYVWHASNNYYIKQGDIFESRI